MHRYHEFKLSPTAFLRLSLTVLVVGAAVGVAAVFFSMNTVDRRARRAADHADAAALLAQAQQQMSDAVDIMERRRDTFLASPEMAALSPRDQMLVHNELARQDSEPTTSELPAVNLGLEPADAAAFHRTVDALAAEGEPLVSALTEGQRQQNSRGQLLRSMGALAAYNHEASVSNFRVLLASLTEAREEIRQSVPDVVAIAARDEASSKQASATARIASVATMLAMVLAVAGLVWMMARRLQAYLERYNSEREQLQKASDSLSYRNQQLNALYNVFCEITDTLSLPYVVNATTREALRVMNANMVVLRLLRGDQLVVVGNLTSEGKQLEGMLPERLGEGPSGRAAKRGRSVHIREGAQQQLGVPRGGEDSTQAAVESGIIAPLIVGARVVGTLAVWSRQQDAFNEEDQRVLEMMASQVATAVVVADTTEASERRAHQDALTGLPNRLRLTEDIAGDLAELCLSGRKAVVAMADIDHFKNLNDDHGHHVGDVTLQQVAHVLRSSVRGSDRVYRYGGEEFVIVFLDADTATGIELAERVRRAIGDTPLSGDELQPIGPVTMSIGLAAVPDHGADMESLIWLADHALYQAKESGRNRVVMFDAKQPSVTQAA